MGEPRFQREKFKELLLYITQREDPKRGDMKLNKLLYFADVTAYRRRGKPISGAKYQHQPHGPVASPLVPIRRELEAEGRLDFGPRDYHGRPQTATHAKDEPDLELFDDEELAIIDEVIEKFRDFDGTAMEKITHQEPGWQMTDDDEVMPYRGTLLARVASPRAVERGRQLAKRLGW